MRKKAKIRMYEGLPVVDADESIMLHILPEDVKGSRKADPANCAAARACKRELKKEAKVYKTRIYIKNKNSWTRYITPMSITKEIVAFDRGASFEPGEYTVKAVPQSARLGYHRGKSTEKSGLKKNKKPYHITANVRKFDKP
jgi:hypothetical protein